MMVTNSEAEVAPPTRRQTLVTQLRVLIAGHPDAQVRRLILWLGLFACLGLAAWVPAIIVAALLFGTDKLV